MLRGVDRTGEPLRWPGDVEAVTEGLQTAPEDAIKMACDTAVEAVLATVPPAGVLRTMDERCQRFDEAEHTVTEGLATCLYIEVRRTFTLTAGLSRSAW